MPTDPEQSDWPTMVWLVEPSVGSSDDDGAALGSPPHAQIRKVADKVPIRRNAFFMRPDQANAVPFPMRAFSACFGARAVLRNTRVQHGYHRVARCASLPCTGSGRGSHACPLVCISHRRADRD